MKARYEIEYSWGKYGNLDETLIVETNNVAYTIEQLGRNRTNFEIKTVKLC